MPYEAATEDERRQMAVWLTPTSAEVMALRAEIVASLGAGPVAERELRASIAPPQPRQFDVGTFEATRRLVGDVLTESDPRVLDVRRANAFGEAVRQLEHDRMIERVPAAPALEVRGSARRSSSTHGFRETFAPDQGEGLRLVSQGRGWTGADHEAFDPRLYAVGPRARLVTADGALLIEEAIEAHRLGRYLSATIVLGTFAETAWYVAAALIEPRENRLTTELQRAAPRISTIQDVAIEFLRHGARYLAANLDTWATSTRVIRNFGAHGNLSSATTGSFTESASAARIMDCYRHIEELEQALQANGL